MIYLDNAATSFPKPPEVLAAIELWFEELGVDASRGSSARHEEVGVRVTQCRQRLGQLTGAQPRHVIFCSGATEALNLYIKGTLREGDRVWATQIEHSAVVRPLVGLREREGVDVRFLEAAFDVVEAATIDAALDAGAAPEVFVYSHASNVTGRVQDMSAVLPRLRAAGTRVLVDCAQTAGLLDLTALEADAFVIPGHKELYGPPGIGALCLRGEPSIAPLREGGTGSSRATDRMPDELPAGLEGGTPNTPGIFGWLAGIDWVLARGIDAMHAHGHAMVRVLREELAPSEASGALRLIGGVGPETHTAVLSAAFRDVDPVEVAMILEGQDIYVRAGFHCAPYVHDAIDTAAGGTVRLSPGAFNTEDEMRQAARAIREIAG